MAFERPADVIENCGVDVLHEVRVKGAEVAQIAEFVDETCVNLSRIHLQLVCMLDVDVLPELSLSLRKLVLA